MNDKIEQKESEEQTDQPVKSELVDNPDKPDQGDNDKVKKEQGPVWVSELDSYPLRKKDEDPGWAVRTVWIWIGFALVCLAGILLLLILGAIYD